MNDDYKDDEMAEFERQLNDLDKPSTKRDESDCYYPDDDFAETYKPLPKAMTKKNVMRFLHKWNGNLTEVAKEFTVDTATLQDFIYDYAELDEVYTRYQRSIELVALELFQKIVLDPTHKNHFAALVHVQKLHEYKTRYPIPRSKEPITKKRTQYEELVEFQEEIKRLAKENEIKQLGLKPELSKPDTSLDAIRAELDVPPAAPIRKNAKRKPEETDETA